MRKKPQFYGKYQASIYNLYIFINLIRNNYSVPHYTQKAKNVKFSKNNVTYIAKHEELIKLQEIDSKIK